MQYASPQHDEYIARINRVIDYVENNLDGDLTLIQLAEVAGFSPFHFHRIFRVMVGETLFDFIRRVRIERAAHQLIVNPKTPITQIALGAGFTSSATFARAFRDAYAMSASAWRYGGFRQHAQVRDELRKTGKLASKPGKDSRLRNGYTGVASDTGIATTDDDTQRRTTVFDYKTVPVRIEDMPELHLAYVRHVGPYQGDGKLFEGLFGRLMRWAGPRGLTETPDGKALVIYHDNPEITDESRLRISVCLTVPEDTPVHGEVGKMAIPAGRYACARFELGDDEYQAAWDYVFGQWLPSSGYQPDDRPSFEMFPPQPEELPPGKRLVEICVPVRPL